MLIGCGATHNFIAQRLVLEEKLKVGTMNYGVIMGTGTAVKGKGLRKGA